MYRVICKLPSKARPGLRRFQRWTDRQRHSSLVVGSAWNKKHSEGQEIKQTVNRKYKEHNMAPGNKCSLPTQKKEGSWIHYTSKPCCWSSWRHLPFVSAVEVFTQVQHYRSFLVRVRARSRRSAARSNKHFYYTLQSAKFLALYPLSSYLPCFRLHIYPLIRLSLSAYPSAQ